MTLTEHTKRIEQLASQTQVSLHEAHYRKVIANLESMRSHVHSAISIYHDIMAKKPNCQDFQDLI